MKKGDQIVYMPDHADGPNHPDAEFGFIMSLTPDGKGAFCRYWRKGNLGKLRTIANSERTDWRNLSNYQSVPQFVVENTIDMIEDNPDRYGVTK